MLQCTRRELPQIIALSNLDALCGPCSCMQAAHATHAVSCTWQDGICSKLGRRGDLACNDFAGFDGCRILRPSWRGSWTLG